MGKEEDIEVEEIERRLLWVLIFLEIQGEGKRWKRGETEEGNENRERNYQFLSSSITLHPGKYTFGEKISTETQFGISHCSISLGVTTEGHPSPSPNVPCIILHHNNHTYILSYSPGLPLLPPVW